MFDNGPISSFNNAVGLRGVRGGSLVHDSKLPAIGGPKFVAKLSPSIRSNAHYFLASLSLGHNMVDIESFKSSLRVLISQIITLSVGAFPINCLHHELLPPVRSSTSRSPQINIDPLQDFRFPGWVVIKRPSGMFAHNAVLTRPLTLLVGGNIHPLNNLLTSHPLNH